MRCSNRMKYEQHLIETEINNQTFKVASLWFLTIVASIILGMLL